MIYIVGILVLALSWVLPWWGFAVICFGLGPKMKSGWSAFGLAFVAVFCVWGIVAYIENIQSHGRMANAMAELFSLPHPMLMIAATACFGGVLAGLWCLSGYHLSQLLKKKKTSLVSSL